MTRLRVAVAGVVRRRQGIGEHLARFAARDADVVAFLGSRAATLDEGRAVLARHGIDARGFTDLAELLRTCPVDALVIASPAGTHLDPLEAARDAGVHVLCEKPLVHGGPDDAAVTERLVAGFAERGLVLWENCQWPFTLPAYDALHPGARERPLKHFEMWLSPMAGGGASMLRECMSHPLSLLQVLAEPDGAISGLLFSSRDARADALEVSFRYPCGGAGAAVRVRLAACPEQPRPAGFAVNGLRAERRVRLADYALSFRHGPREVPVPDPTPALVLAFLAAVRGGGEAARGVSGHAVSWRARALAEIVAGFERVSGRM